MHSFVVTVFSYGIVVNLARLYMIIYVIIYVLYWLHAYIY